MFSQFFAYNACHFAFVNRNFNFMLMCKKFYEIQKCVKLMNNINTAGRKMLFTDITQLK